MTEQAYRRLRDNQYQRVAGSGLILSFPNDASAASWASDDREIDRFVARYLNAARLADSRIETVAEHRRKGDDVSISACDECPIRPICHETFGNVTLGETVIGLFPFRPGTAPYLLTHLDEAQKGVRQTQRGLLDHVMKPVMRYMETLDEGERYALTLPISRRQPNDWQTISETFLGGWPSADTGRLRLLAEAWTRKTKAFDMAGDLQPLLKPFLLPEFSAKAPEIARVEERRRYSPTTMACEPPPRLHPLWTPPSRTAADLLNRLEQWWAENKRSTPKDSGHAAQLLRGAMPLDDIRVRRFQRKDCCATQSGVDPLKTRRRIG